MNREQKLKLARLKQAREAEPETVADDITKQLAENAVVNRLNEDMDDIKETLTTVTEHIIEDDSLVQLKDQLAELKGTVDESHNITLKFDTSKLEEIVATLDLKPEIKTGDVVVDTGAVAGEVQKLQEAIKEAAGSNSLSGVEKALEKLIKAAETKPPQRPEDYLPYRRVIKNGNKLEFDDTPGQGGGGGGGSVSPTIAELSTLLNTYGISRIDDSSDPEYYGFEDNNENWYILRNSSGVWQYYAGDGGIATNWAGRAGYTYIEKGAAF